jgi:ribosome-binding factor A
MSSRRTLKAAEAIREVVSMAILAELKDPRVRDVTVTHVEVAGDMRQAKIHVSVMGDDTKQRLCLRGLESSAGFLQSKVASRIDTRYTPKLEFVLDQGVKKSIEIAAILNQVLPKKPVSDVPQEQEEDETEADETEPMAAEEDMETNGNQSKED